MAASARDLYSFFKVTFAVMVRAKRIQEQVLGQGSYDLSENKGSIRKIAAAYGIPNSTLHAHYRGISKKRYGGHSTALTYQEEQEIVYSCIVLQEMGFPLDKASLTSLVGDYIYIRESGRDNPFCEGVPGPDWFAGFMRR